MKSLFLSGYFIGLAVTGVLSEVQDVPHMLPYFGDVNTTEFPFQRELLPWRITNGNVIHVVGKVAAEPKRIYLNIHKGENYSDSDILLLLSLRWDEGFLSGNIVYNTKSNSEWSKNEQRLDNPFEANQSFDLRIGVREDHLEIYGNRKYLGNFKKTNLLTEGESWSVGGDITSLEYLEHRGGAGCTMPCVDNLPNSTLPWKRVDYSIYPKGDRVDVNFYNKDSTKYPISANLELQVSIRYDEGAVVRNSQVDGEWGTEDRSGGLPIEKDEIFDLTVVVEQGIYYIFFNRKYFAKYEHRQGEPALAYTEFEGNAELLVRRHFKTPGY